MLKNIICFPHKLGQKLNGVDLTPELYTNHLKKKFNLNFLVDSVHCGNRYQNFNMNIKKQKAN